MAIEIISGTNRTGAISIQIASYYQEILQDLGQASNIIDLKELPQDFIFSDLYKKEVKNDSFKLFRERMLRAEKFIFIVPEYNGSFPGVLKAFIDGLEFPNTFTNKKCALVGVSAGIQGAGLAMSHLTDIFNYCGMNVLALKPKLSHISQNLTEGKVTNSLFNELLRKQASLFIHF